jgi:ribonuclease D
LDSFHFRPLINSDDKLAVFLPRLRPATWVALDTEADSLHAYPEKLCLVQLSIDGEDALVDPLSGLDLGPLWEALSRHELIMHGSDYDLRLLRRHHAFVPRGLFDTMLAARLLGLAQFGLSDLLNNYLGVTLDKGVQKADWARRPLTPRMEIYARNDTRHLKPLADKLAGELEAKGRLEWHREWCARWIEDSVQPSAPNLDLVWRIKGANKFSRRGLAVVRELWRWREQEARESNKPPYFILAHEVLLDLAGAAESGHGANGVLPRHLSERRRAGVLAAVETALALPEADLPHPLRNSGRRASDMEKRRMSELERRRDREALALGLDPSLVASRATIVALAMDPGNATRELMNWQRKLLEL